MITEVDGKKNDILRMEPIQMDALQEMGNIAASHAATSLSDLLRKNILLDVSSCKVYPVESLPKALDGLMGEVAAVYFNINGQTTQNFLLLFTMEMARWLSDSLFLREPAAGQTLDDMDKHALCEIGNICACAYLNVIAKFLDLTLVPSPPSCTVDTVKSILQFPACLVADTANFVVVLETKFTHDNEAFSGFILFIPDPDSQSKIMKRFGVD